MLIKILYFKIKSPGKECIDIEANKLIYKLGSYGHSASLENAFPLFVIYNKFYAMTIKNAYFEYLNSKDDLTNAYFFSTIISAALYLMIFSEKACIYGQNRLSTQIFSALFFISRLQVYLQQ